MAEIVKPFAVAEPRLRSVKLGRSSLESPRLGAESAVVTAASNAPVPLQLLLAPHDWFIAWLAARIRSYHAQFVLALKCLQKAVELNPGHFLLWLEQGRCQQALHLVGAAENSFQQARQLNRDCAEATQALTRLSETGLFQRLRGRLKELFKR